MGKVKPATCMCEQQVGFSCAAQVVPQGAGYACFLY